MARSDGEFKRGHKPKPPKYEYGKQRIGRPVVDKPRKGPACETCRNLDTSGRQPHCKNGHALRPNECGEHLDCSYDRIVVFGGISGVLAR